MSHDRFPTHREFKQGVDAEDDSVGRKDVEDDAADDNSDS